MIHRRCKYAPPFPRTLPYRLFWVSERLLERPQRHPERALGASGGGFGDEGVEEVLLRGVARRGLFGVPLHRDDPRIVVVVECFHNVVVAARGHTKSFTELRDGLVMMTGAVGPIHLHRLGDPGPRVDRDRMYVRAPLDPGEPVA